MSPLVLRQNCVRAKSISRIKFFCEPEPISCDSRNHPFFAVQVGLQRSVTYNVPSQPTFLACIPLPGRINITVNVYTRTALRATVSLTLLFLSLPLSSSFSLFFLFLHELQRVPVPVSHFFSSRGEPSRLIFFPVAHPTNTVVYNSPNRPEREISTYLRTCEMNVGAGDTSLKRRADDFPSVRPPFVFGN